MVKYRKKNRKLFKDKVIKMITADQLKDVMDRADALHRYLNIDQKK